MFEKYHFNSMINSISDHFLLINENILSLNLVEILFDSNIITAKTVQILYNETGRCKDKWRFHGHSRRFISAENSNPNPHIPVIISSTFLTYILSRFLNHSWKKCDVKPVTVNKSLNSFKFWVLKLWKNCQFVFI